MPKEKNIKLEIQIEGRTRGDVETALHEVSEKLKQGYNQGADRNVTRRYYFETTN